MLDWLRTESRFDVVNLPFALLIGLARPLRQALKAPIACTLQGEDLFLENLRNRGSRKRGPHPQAVADVDLFIAVSDYYADFTVDYLGVPLAEHERCRSASTSRTSTI